MNRRRPAARRRPYTSGRRTLNSANGKPAGACRDADPELFFPAAYGDAHAQQIDQAKQVCRSCPLADACLRYAIEHGEFNAGIWGGLTPKERQQLIVAQLTREATA